MPDRKTDPRITLLLANLDYAFDRTAWHGPNLSASIRGVRARDASQSLRGRKSIWEQVLHAAYWKQNVVNKLTGMSQRFPRSGSVWPRMPDGPSKRTEKAWRGDVQLLHDVHRALAQIAKVDANRLDMKLTRRILGVAAHDLYHAGQINLLKRIVRS